MASPDKKSALIRMDPLIHEAVQRWADEDMRSFNMQVEYILREALRRAGRKPAKPSKKVSGPESPVDPQ